MYQELINTRLKLLEGNLERINPELPIEDQLDFLPYDMKYEFPINHLVFGITVFVFIHYKFCYILLIPPYLIKLLILI